MAGSTRGQIATRAVRRATRKVRHYAGRGESGVRDLGEQIAAVSARADFAADWVGPEHLRVLRESFRPSDELRGADGRTPLVWWTDTANYGDLLSPWLLGRIAQRAVAFPARGARNMVAVGSIVTRARNDSVVWGSGSFGSERRSLFAGRAEYRAVRGPLTRSKLLDVGIECPRVYGDPALLVPLWFWPHVEQTHEVGVIIRHSEHHWRDAETDPAVRVIDFGTNDVEQTTRDILACKRIVSSSLHGLVIADAYGIPNAWLGAERSSGGSRPNGGEFKYHDYFASVSKLRHPQHVDLRGVALDVDTLDDRFEFDDRPIEFDHEALLAACPVLTRG